MKKYLISSIAGLSLLLPFVGLAASYDYITTQGVVRTVEAPNADVALSLVRNEVLHSGVKLDSGLLSSGDLAGNYYMYIDRSGNPQIITASSFDAAFLLSITDCDPLSGVRLMGRMEQ